MDIILFWRRLIFSIGLWFMHRFILLKLLLLIFFHFSIGLEFLWIFLCTYYNKLIDALNSRRNILHYNKFDRRYLRLDRLRMPRSRNLKIIDSGIIWIDECASISIRFRILLFRIVIVQIFVYTLGTKIFLVWSLIRSLF